MKQGHVDLLTNKMSFRTTGSLSALSASTNTLPDIPVDRRADVTRSSSTARRSLPGHSLRDEVQEVERTDQAVPEPEEQSLVSKQAEVLFEFWIRSEPHIIDQSGADILKDAWYLTTSHIILAIPPSHNAGARCTNELPFPNSEVLYSMTSCTAMLM